MTDLSEIQDGFYNSNVHNNHKKNNNKAESWNNNKKNKKGENGNTNKCYTCKPRGTVKDHIISETDHFVFHHDMFRRPMVIITSKEHYHTIYEIPNDIKVKLFDDIKIFIDFWNLNKDYQIILNNGDSQTHHHFHCKLKINEFMVNRMRRDHFTLLNLQKSYNSVDIITNNGIV